MKPTIQESSGAADRTGKLSRPKSGSLVTRPATSDWEDDGSVGFSYKPLFEDLQTGQSTVLMKVDAGVVAPPHAHDKLEQVLVLEGDFYDESAPTNLAILLFVRPVLSIPVAARVAHSCC